jgi:O-antigen ligase
MIDKSLYSGMTGFTGSIGIILLLSISTSWEISRVCFAIVGFFSLFYFAKSSPVLTREQKIFCYPIIFFFISALISYLVNEKPDRGPQIFLETYSYLFLAIPLLYLYSRHPPKLSIVWGMFLIGAIAIGIGSIIEVWGMVPYYRAGGSTGQAVLFSTIAVSFVGIASASYGFMSTQKYRVVLVVVLAVGLSFTATVMSGSRGSWLAVPVSCLVIVLFHFNQSSWLKKLSLIITTLFFVSIVSYQIPFVGKRVDKAISQSKDLITKNLDMKERNTSVGARVAMWRAAFAIFGENAIFGIGPDNYKLEMKKYVEAGNGIQSLSRHKHAHNELINALMTKGLLGALALLFMFGSHFYVFMNYLRNNNSSNIRGLALAGCLVIVSYFVLGLTSAPLERKITLAFYAFSLAVLLGKIISMDKSSSTDTDV